MAILSSVTVASAIRQNRQLYFAAGADEIRLYDLEGRLSHFTGSTPTVPTPNGTRIPNFPVLIG